MLGLTMVALGKANKKHDTVINCILYFKNYVEPEKLRELAKTYFVNEWRFCSILKTGGIIFYKFEQEMNFKIGP